MNIIRNAYGEAVADLTKLNRMEAEAGEIKETTREEFQEIAKREALGTIAEALEEIGSRLTKKRRENAAQAIHCARVKLMRDADTTAKDVRAALKVLAIVDECAENAADELRAFNGWNDVPEVVRDLLQRLGYPVEHVQTAEEKATAEAKAVAAGTLTAVRNACKKYDKDTARVVVKASAEAFAEVLEEHAEKLQQLPEIAATYRAAAGELAEMLKELDGVEQPAEQPAEPAESTQSDRARSAYLNTCDECEAIEATGTREAMHEAKKLRTLAAEALAHYLRTYAPEWVDELETLHREACAYSPDGLQNQRSGAEGIGYHHRE